MIKRSPLLLALSLAALAACDAMPDQVDSQHQAVLTGTADATGFPAVCGMFVTPPVDDNGNPQDPFYCSCTLVGERVVLTAARCVYDNVAAGTVSDIAVHFGPSFSDGEATTIEEIEIHRYFNPDSAGLNELALILLAAPPTDVTPVTIGTDAIDTSAVGDDVTLVGYGDALEGTGRGSRRKATAQITAVAGRYLTAGTPDVTTCNGDGGGPVFDAAGTQIAMTVRQSSCNERVQRLRTDVYADEFINAYIDRFEGACPADGTCTTTGCRTPDPDCDDCSWNGVCKEDCPTRDWDCDLGAFIGEACQQSGDCEEGGRCLAAADDSTFTYCTRPCDPNSSENGCPATMECVAGDSGNECVFLTPSPGSQGFACDSAIQCRSGICEDRICVNPCDPGGAACPDPYVCGPSKEMQGQNVCLGDDLSGGGGFCAIGTPAQAERRRASTWLLLLLAGIGLIGLRARRGVA